MIMEKVNIELSKDEALVLFEFLHQIGQENRENIFEDKAEQIVVWNIESLLEKLLIEPLSENYNKLLIVARKNVRNEF